MECDFPIFDCFTAVFATVLRLILVYSILDVQWRTNDRDGRGDSPGIPLGDSPGTGGCELCIDNDERCIQIMYSVLFK